MGPENGMNGSQGVFHWDNGKINFKLMYRSLKMYPNLDSAVQHLAFHCSLSLDRSTDLFRISPPEQALNYKRCVKLITIIIIIIITEKKMNNCVHLVILSHSRTQ